ncbi:prepilin-type cleavage/methylation protein [Parvimonas sp. KA00067]|uniref:type II secretion system protein n=1 Tax=Parvimonas sp. KA00067 TaxID=1588755 RepID=UPI0007961BD7|nr:type II secretion system protein [Parvimonas sp. KA00067]KXB67438.1 prepilin-type cleavage/methylation protein [Parvimonas sp. KA00067]
MIKKKAFTLIELIVCLAIISVMVLVIKVNFVNNKKTIAIEELNLIAESIENAKVFSIETGKVVTLKSDAKNEVFNIYSKDYVFKEIHCKNLNILNSVELNFNINGVPSEGKTFKFSYEKENYEIRIRPATGFVNVVKDED